MTRNNFTRDFEPPLYAMQSDHEDAGLNPLFGFVNRQKWLIGGLTVVCAGLTLLAVNVVPAKYIGEAVVEPGANAPNIGNNDNAANPQPISPELVRSEIDVVQSHAVVDNVIKSLNLLNDPELNTRSLLSRLFSPPRLADKSRELQGIVEDNVLSKLKVDNDGRSFGLHITFASKSPDKAAAVANAFAQQYVQQQIALRSSSAQKTVQWLDSRMDSLRDSMNKSTAELADFKIQHRLFDVQQSGANAGAAGGVGQTVAGQQLGELNNQLAVAKANAAIAETKLKAAIQNGAGVASTSVLSSPIIQALVTEEAQVQQKIADLQSHVGPKYPALIAAQSQLVQIQDKIRLETGNVVAGLSADAAAAKVTETLINARLTAVESQSATELTQRVRLEELQHQADSDRQIYQDFLSKQAVTAEQALSSVPGATILAPATSPLFPAFPKKKLLFMIGSVFSFLFAVAVAYLVDAPNRRPRRMSPPLDAAPVQTAA